MNNKLYIILLFFLGCSVVAGAQHPVTVHLNSRPIIELFNAIEKQTDLHVYFHPEDTTSTKVTINAVAEEAVDVLKKALETTNLKVTLFEKSLIITQNHELITSLPDNFYLNEKEKGNFEESYIDIPLLGNRREQKATSENKVYEIGDATDNRTGKVTLSGTVTDFKTGEPVTGATLFIREPMTGVTTDAFGYYSILLPVGRQELIIQGMGIKETKRQLAIYSEGKLDIELEEQVYTLKEVTVSSERMANVRNTTLGVERMAIKDIRNIPTAFGEIDVIKIIMTLPGVKSVGEASGGFNVRGGATDQNLILFNEGMIYNPSHLFGLFSVFNPDVVKDIELYKSSIPAKYGGRISSVLDINSKEGNKKEFKGSASIGLLTSRLTIEGPLFSEKTSYLLGGRTTYSDWILGELPQKSGYRNGKAGFYDMNAVINHKFNERNNLYINGYFSRDRFSFNAEEKYAYRNANASVKWRTIINPQFTGVFTGGYDHYDYTTTDESNPITAYKLGFDIDQFFGKADFTWYMNDKHTFDFGLNTLFYNLNPGTYLPHGKESLVIKNILQKEKALESSIYIGDRWELSPKLSFNAGIRYSMFNVIGPRTYNTYAPGELPSLSTIDKTVSEDGLFKTYHGAEFRLSGRYAFSDDFSVKAGFNTMRQNIHKLSNTTVMSPTDTWKLSDANIKPQTGSQTAFGIYKNFADNMIETSIEAYYKTMNDYLDYRGGAELIMNPHIETDVLSTEGRAYGIEFMIKKALGKLNGWVSYTYSRTELRQNDPMITEPVNNGDWYPADFDKPHDIKFVGNYKFTHRYSLSLNCDYSTGRPITLPVSKYQYKQGEYIYFSDRNQYRIPDFFRMDVAFNIEPGHHLTLLTQSTISLGVYNVTGRKNAYSVYYISENGRLQGYKLAIFGIPIPYISYNIKF